MTADSQVALIKASTLVVVKFQMLLREVYIKSSLKMEVVVMLVPVELN